jgi:hypothetical protein
MKDRSDRTLRIEESAIRAHLSISNQDQVG